MVRIKENENRITWKISPVSFRTALLLACFTFLYMCTSTYTYENSQNRFFYILNLLLTGCGFLIYPLLKNIPDRIKRPASIIGFGFFLCLPAVIAILQFDLICSLSIFNGIMGGYSYDLMRLLPGRERGRSFAYGSCLALFAEFLLKCITVMLDTIEAPLASFASDAFLPAWMTIAVLMFAIIQHAHFRQNEAECDRIGIKELPQKDFLIKRLLCIAFVTTAMYVLGNYMDGYLFDLQVRDASAILYMHFYKFFGIVPIYLLMGFLWDYQKKVKLTSVITLALTFTSLLWPLYFMVSDIWSIPFYMEHVMAGVMIAFVNLEFWEIASWVREGAWFSGLGRILDCIVTATLAYLSFSYWPKVIVQLLFVVLAILVVIFLWIAGEFAVSSEKGGKDPLSDNRDDEFLTKDHIDAFAEHFGLTEREQEVLVRMISTEETGQEMANALFISRRVLVKHTSAIYSKTGSAGRVGLMRTFYNFTADKNKVVIK